MTSLFVHRTFFAQATASPHNIAISYGHRQITYRELAAYSCNLAEQLLARGPQQGIEERLRQFPGVVDAAVIDHEDAQDNKYLCAYVVLRDGTGIDVVKAVAVQQLDDFVRPSMFVTLPELPRTLSGKIDRRSLPQPGILRDCQRTNLLLHEKSPLLWFYLRKGQQHRDYRQICLDILPMHFAKAQTRQKSYLRNEECYELTASDAPYPRPPVPSTVEKLLAATDSSRPLREILAQLDIAPTLAALHKIRMYLTTSAFPYWRAI